MNSQSTDQLTSAGARTWRTSTDHPDAGASIGVELQSSAFQAVIFDCDGTLVDSETAGTQVDQAVLADFGWIMTVEEVAMRFRGRSHSYFQGEIERFLGHALSSGWESRYASWYAAAHADVTAMPHAGIVTSRLQDDYVIGVASNGSRAATVAKLRQTSLAAAFGDRIYSSDDVVEGKPAPDLFLHAAEMMGVDPRSCLVIEDSEAGVQSAKEANMAVIAVRHENPHCAQIEALGVHMIDDLSALPLILGCLS